VLSNADFSALWFQSNSACNAYAKNLLSQVCVNSSYHLFSALSIKADHPMACRRENTAELPPPRGGREREKANRVTLRREDIIRLQLKHRRP
jgi:hypothetical protein